ncbi:MAG: nucleoside triphosphate pyrophosphohydrolase [Phascolarctobacterium sp.]|nr:nucleoside triphosphate pyrophosphohydrolase [Candidatus Phascolarctobacterium caballi]
MGKIMVVGLGPGKSEYLSLETLNLLRSQTVVLRTAIHPTVEYLRQEKISFTSCDDLYETGKDFETVYQTIVQRILNFAQDKDVVYAVPGSPLVAERTVVLLREQAQTRKIELVIKPALSFLDLAYTSLQIDPIDGLRIIDAADKDALQEAGNYPLMITQVYSQFVAGDVKLALMDTLPDDYDIYFLRNLGLDDEECRKIKLFELDRQENIDHLTSVYIPQQEKPKSKYKFDITPLTDIMQILREPGGCPWDREQNHKSIRQNFIEEVYEFLEAVDTDDVAGMREELGDVLMQVVFHARMAQEAERFDLQDVIDEVTDKLIRRHPHVFGDVKVDNSTQVLSNWDAIKKQEKTERKSVLDGVTKDLPSLLRAYKLQSKAAKVGFDWHTADECWQKVDEEIKELQEAIQENDKTHTEEELGDLLFAIVNFARKYKIEPEVALNGTNNKFVRRFSYVEDQVKKSGKNWEDFDLPQLDVFWCQAKHKKM